MGAINSSRIALLLCLLSSSAVGQSLLDKKLSIVVYDAAHVGPKTLGRAERLAGTILLEAGIPSSWNAGAIEELENLGTDFTAYPGTKCQAEPIAPILRLRILSHAVDGVAAQTLGFSLPCARQGVQVTIYADRVANVSETGGPTFGRVLAYAMVHELGHLLLHSGDHEAEGLMKGVWSKSDWQRAAVRVISFSSADKQRISGFHEQFADWDTAQLAIEEVAQNGPKIERATQTICTSSSPDWWRTSVPFALLCKRLEPASSVGPEFWLSFAQHP